MSSQDVGGQADHGGQENAENAFALSFPKGEESFPVLKAFQEFLDAERERARRRQTTLAICFMSALVVLVVMFCVVGAIIFSGMMRRNDAQQERMLDLLLQRTAVAAEVRKPEAAAPVQSDAAINELIQMVKQLKAENAAIASRNATSADSQPPAVTALPAPNVDSAPAGNPPVVAPAGPVKKTGIFSSPKRRPEPVPEVSPSEAKPSADSGVSAANASDGDPGEWKTVQVRVAPSREMHVPDGYAAEEMSVVSDKNVRMPLRVLMPTGADAKAVAP